MFDHLPIQKFMARVRQAANMNAKDIKLTTAEALELSACLVQVLSSQVSTALQEKTIKVEAPLRPGMDGGEFKR